MKSFIYLVAYLYLKITVEALGHVTLKNYLYEKMRSLAVREEVLLKRSISDYHIQLLEYLDHRDSWNFAHPFMIFDSNYIMMDKDLHKLFRGKSLNLCAHAFCGHIVEVVEEEKPITKAEIIKFGNLTIMYVVFQDRQLKIVKFENDILNYQEVQTIEHPHISDVEFFISQGNLFLIVCNQIGSTMLPISLYEWLDDHFDEQTTFFMEGITQVEIIEDEENQVILMLQKKKNMSFCIVYEFEEKNFMKTQVIRVDEPKFVIPYKIENEQYVMFLSNHKQSVYRWNGLELMEWSSQDENSNFEKVSLMYFNNTPIMFASSLDKFIAYKPTPDMFEVLQVQTYKYNFTKILNVGYVKENGSEFLFVVGNIEDSGMLLAYNVDVWQSTDTETPLHDPLHDCLSELIDQLQPNESGTTIKKITASVIKATPKSMASYSMDKRLHEIKDIEIEDKISEIEEKYSSLSSVLGQLDDINDKMVINGDVIIEGTLESRELLAENINLNIVNSKKWLPHQWLSYKKNQTIPGSVDANILRVKKLITTPEVDIFNDVILNNTNVRFGGNSKIGNLTSTRIYVDTINNIKMSDVVLKTRDAMIGGVKTFSHVTATSVEATKIQNKTSQVVLNQIFIQTRQQTPKFASNVFIEDLEVDGIDNVNWNTFKHSVFRYGITKGITGNLRIKEFEAGNLDIFTLNGEEVDNFFTTSTNQTIDASMKFHHIYATNINANSVNGLDISNVVATVNSPVIKGPTSIEDMHIQGNLFLNYSKDNTSPSKDNQHIVGTDESDLLQIYSEPIKIVGNLVVKNLRVPENSSIFIGENEEIFNPSLEEKYWMKSRNQIINVHVEAQGGITTPHLQTKLLNGNGISNFLLNNTNRSFPASFSFENATFLGNVFLNNEKSHVPDLNKINIESVKLNGNFIIEGKKIFKDFLKIKFLNADILNDVNKNQLVTSNIPNNFTGKKIFENLLIHGNFTTKNHSCQELNGVNLMNIQKDAVYIDRPQEINSLNFSSAYVEDLRVHTLNDRPIGEHLIKANDMLNNNVIDSLIIKGNLTIGNLLNLSKINEKDPDVLYTNKLKLDERGFLQGNVRFADNVTIDNLSASVINNINFPILTRRLLYKDSNQNITGMYSFKNLKTDNLVAPKINNISIIPLVNIGSTAPQQIIAPGGIEFGETVLKRLNSDNISPCNIDEVMKTMKSPPTQFWSKMTIKGNVTILDPDNALYDIFENVVLLDSKNTIEAPVQFSNISVENLQTFHHINDVNLTEILMDALLKESDTEQFISGKNYFQRLSVFSASVGNNSDIPVVNELVEVSEINKKLIVKDEVNHISIKGKKTFFAGLQAVKIEAKTVSNLIPENIVTFDNQKIIPSATFENIQINEDFQVDSVNGHDFNHFLRERLLIDGPFIQEVNAVYYFHDVHIAGNVTAFSINGMNISDIVFDVNDQEITNRKTFLNDVNITGNIDITMLNGHVLSDIYEKVLLRNEQSYIKKNVQILAPSRVDGIITADSVNGYPLEKIRQILDKETNQMYAEEINQTIRAIEISAKENAMLIEGITSEIMYIEKIKEIEMFLPSNIQEAKAFRLKDYVLIQIIGYQEGKICGLPEECRCPRQYTVQISPDISINTVESKGSQRVYFHNDERMIVHLVTDSLSTDTFCRSNSTEDEHSRLAWHTNPSESVTGESSSHTIELFPGYVSAAEYFSFENTTYVIVGNYFNAQDNSYELDCVVFKFSKDRTFVTEVQRIKTNGLWSLKVFYTVQGVTLILGMLGDGHPIHNLEKTLFMRFDPNAQQFKLLREVQAYGCASSVGIVLKSDSFITLYHKIHPILIFKYDHHQDNYVYYQNLWDELPIRGISVFYTGDFGISDPHLCVVSDRGSYSIYTYKYIEGWQRKFHGLMKGLKYLVPFEWNEKLYLFAPSTNVSYVLSIVMFGSE